MSNKAKKELALKMFLDGKSTYEIHINTKLGFREIEQYLAKEKEPKKRHAEQLKANREAVAYEL